MTDYISRADAMAYIDRVTNSGLGRNKSLDYIHKYISALPSAELTKGDLISRADAIEAVRGLSVLIDDDDFPYFEDALKALPSADAVQGEWVRKEKEYNDCDGHRFVYWYECSVCGARPLYTRFVNEKLTNFCPNCGARMCKGGDSE